MRNDTLRSRSLKRAAMASFALAVLLASGPAEGRSYYLMHSLGGARMIIDPGAIEPVANSSVRRMWTVTVQANIMNETPPQPGYVRALNEYDCDAQKSRWRSFTAFSRSGAILLSRENPAADWVDATPSGGAYAEWRVACGYSRGDSAIEADGIAKVVIALMRGFDPAPVVAVLLPTAPKLKLAPPVVKPKSTPPAARPKAPLKQQ